MKSTIVPYETRALCLRIVCRNGLTVRLANYPFDLKMSNGQVYLTGSGYDATAYSASATMSPNVVDLEGVLGAAGISRDVIVSGVFDNARAYCFACNFLNPVEDEEPLLASTLGKVMVKDDRYIVEEMGLVDALNQTVGDTYQPLCQHTFGDAGCGISLASVTVTGTLTGASGQQTVIDTTRGEAADFFTAGSIVFTSGPNAGLRKIEVEYSAAGGVVTLSEPLYYPPAAGHAYSLTRGCRKRKADCLSYANVVNAMAFWDMPTTSQYAQVGGLK